MTHTTLALVVAAALLVGCPGGSSPTHEHTPDSGPGLGWPDSGLPATDGASLLPPDLAVAQADSGQADSAAQPCPFGNLLPTLCRAFAAPQPTAPVSDPPTCQPMAQTTLTAGADDYAGSDTVQDRVQGSDGDDTLRGFGCSDELNGNQGADFVAGNEGADKLHGGAGDDTVQGGQGDDDLYGGGGNDTLHGGGGDDTFYYAEGNGHDVIQEFAGYDTIVCAEIYGSPAARLLGWSQSGSDLVLSMSGNGSITVKGYFSSADSSIDAIIGCD